MNDKTYSSNKMDDLILSSIYSYYVKYENMVDIINQQFAGSSATSVNIFIDVNDILCTTENKMVTSSPDIHLSNPLILITGLINMAAHYRQFFKTRYSCATKIYFINSIDNIIAPLYDKKYFHKRPKSKEYIVDDNLMHQICNYIYDVQYISTRVDFGTYTSFIMSYNVDNNPNIIITKDPFELQLCTKSNTFVLRPRKYRGQDTSYMANITNAFYYYNGELHLSATALTTFMALVPPNAKGFKGCGIRKSTAIDILKEYNGRFGIKYPWDTEKEFAKINNLCSKPFNVSEVANRFKAFDIGYLHLRGFKNLPESRLYNGIVNLYDPQGMKKINETFFADNPLDFEVL